MIGRPMIAAALALAATALSSSASAQARRVDFERDVLTILEQRCVECHRAPYRDQRGRMREPKAGLRLDGKVWILRGGEAGEVVVPREPDDSELYLRVSLDADDPDVMPNEGDPLTKTQVETLRRWIAEGADFGGWTGAPGPGSPPATPAPVVKSPRVELLERLANGVPRPSASAIERAAGDVARIAPALPDLALQRVEFISHEAAVGDPEVSALESVAETVTQLDLARTAITDEALGTVGRMPRLTRLDLHETAITDRGLLALTGLEELRYLNLFGTEVTDRGLDAIAGLENLESVYLWRTRVTRDGVERLRKALQGAKVHFERTLPATEPPADTDRRRRR
jgi:hypothetical protein